MAAAPGISNAIVSGALNEATAIWSAAGLTLQWRVSNRAPVAIEPSTVRIILDDARGTASGGDLPIGWITFGPSGMPAPLLHLSRWNANQLLETAAAYRDRPSSYKDLLLARALGRALAHELGHYLMASEGPLEIRPHEGPPIRRRVLLADPPTDFNWTMANDGWLRAPWR